MPTALVIHAHPDDEVFATGAAAAGLAEGGWRILLCVATGGEAGEDPSLPAGEARRRRVARLERSCALLGIADWQWLAEEGRWLDDGAACGPDSLSAADPDELAAAVGRVMTAVRPDLVLSVGRDGLTGHPDHVAIASAVRRAVAATRTFGGQAWGARLRAADVRAAHRLLDGERIGSGRVAGALDGTQLREIGGSAGVEQRRRQALDAYVDGLGTGELRTVLAAAGRRGDSLLLRVVLDVAGWTADRFEPIV